MNKEKTVEITKEEEREAITQMIIQQTDTIAYKLENNSYVNFQCKEYSQDMLLLFSICYASLYGAKKVDDLIKKSSTNLKKKFN